MRILTLLTLLTLLGCDRTPVAGALIINNTDGPVTVTVLDGTYGPWNADPGMDVTAIAAAGPQKLRFDLPDGRKHTLTVLFDIDTLALVAARPGSCMALADHTEQYGGSGEVKVLVTTSPTEHGTLERIPINSLSPNNPLPPDRLEGYGIVRFTTVPCPLLSDPKALVRHLYDLD